MLSVTTLNADRTTVLSGTGDLGIRDVDDMTRALNIALMRRWPVVLDLARTQHLDRALIPCLLVLTRALARRGQRLHVVVDQQTQPARFLREADLDTLMDVAAQ